MGLPFIQPQLCLEPDVDLPFFHVPALLQLLQCPVRQNALVSEISICQSSHRLLRFREGLWSQSGKLEVVCFPQQAEFVRRFLGDRVGVREIPLEAVEKELLKGGDG